MLKASHVALATFLALALIAAALFLPKRAADLSRRHRAFVAALVASAFFVAANVAELALTKPAFPVEMLDHARRATLHHVYFAGASALFAAWLGFDFGRRRTALARARHATVMVVLATIAPLGLLVQNVPSQPFFDELPAWPWAYINTRDSDDEDGFGREALGDCNQAPADIGRGRVRRVFCQGVVGTTYGVPTTLPQARGQEVVTVTHSADGIGVVLARICPLDLTMTEVPVVACSIRLLTPDDAAAMDATQHWLADDQAQSAAEMTSEATLRLFYHPKAELWMVEAARQVQGWKPFAAWAFEPRTLTPVTSDLLHADLSRSARIPARRWLAGLIPMALLAWIAFARFRRATRLGETYEAIRWSMTLTTCVALAAYPYLLAFAAMPILALRV